MSRIFMLLFLIFTVAAAYMTYRDIGLQDSIFSGKSIRSGSSSHIHSGYGYGK